MKGYVMLSEGRSGSNWLGSLANSTGLMGNLTEWLGAEYHDKKIRNYTQDTFFDSVMKQATTKNGRFAIKVFPRHLHLVYSSLGFDFVRRCMNEHETKLILLTRQDTFAQAISLVRGIQTSQWTSRNEKTAEEEYDFEEICRAYFYISRSNQYWKTYLGVNLYPHQRFTYEELLPDTTPLLQCLTDWLDVRSDLVWNTGLKIQRDDKSTEWRERFFQDVKKRDVIGLSGSFGAFGGFAREPEQFRGFSAKVKRLLSR